MAFVDAMIRARPTAVTLCATFLLATAAGRRFCLHHPPQRELRGAVLYLQPFAEEMNNPAHGGGKWRGARPGKVMRYCRSIWPVAAIARAILPTPAGRLGRTISAQPTPGCKRNIRASR